MDEYNYKLEAAFSRFLKQYLKDNPTWNIKGLNTKILKVMNVYPNLDKVHTPAHILLSGDPVSIEIQGSMLVNHSIEHGSRQRNIEFWAQGVDIHFDTKSEDFIIASINKFIPINFH